MLNLDQKNQINSQIEAYENRVSVGKINISLNNNSSFVLEVDEFVANPEIMNSGIQVVEFLKNNQDIVRDKIVTDMGTGSGIIGLAAALLGSKMVYMVDIDKRAVNNASRNIEQLKLNSSCKVFQSDLFYNFKDCEKADIQIFNHPFFSDEPIVGKDWTRMMLGGTELIGEYFRQAPLYSKEDAIYILPWLTLADDEKLDNDPGKRAKEFGFEVVEVIDQKPVKQGIQQALFKIYELKYRK